MGPLGVRYRLASGQTRAGARRGRLGIASALTQRIASEASRFGFSRLYLFTPHNESLYARLGWQTIDSAQLEQVRAIVMELKIDQTPASS